MTKLPLSLVLDSDDERSVLTADCEIVREFLSSKEIDQMNEDDEMFKFFFRETSAMEGWTLYVNEPDKKVYYKYEEGLKLMSALSEVIVEAPMVNVVSLFAEGDLFKDWMPNITHCHDLK